MWALLFADHLICEKRINKQTRKKKHLMGATNIACAFLLFHFPASIAPSLPNWARSMLRRFF